VNPDPIFGTKRPATPYAGSSGASGSAASRDRADREDADGTTGHRQQMIRSLIEAAGPVGLTVAELREKDGLGHHGNISGALSVLHKAGEIACLREQRGRSHPYVSLSVAASLPSSALRPFGGKTIVALGTNDVAPLPDAYRDAMRRVSTDEQDVPPESSRKPLLTPDERRLTAAAKLSLNRFNGAELMPVRTINMRALLALIDRVTS
jgi:hypothetical protein